MNYTTEDYTRCGATMLENHGINKGLLYEYTNILMGQTSAFSAAYFMRGSITNPLMAIEVFRYAIEIFLHWTPEEAVTMLNNDILKEMHLDKIKNYLPIPYGFEYHGDYRWLVHLIYPSKIPYNEKDAVIDVYKAVLNGKANGGLRKFPKGYFDGKSGRERAFICLRYFIGLKGNFKNIEEAYAFFASPEGTKMINNNGLKLVLRDVFQSPVQFFHKSLPEEYRNDFLYHYYEFQYRYDRLCKQKHTYKAIEVSLPVETADYSYEFPLSEREQIMHKCKMVINRIYAIPDSDPKHAAKRSSCVFPSNYFNGKIGLGRLRIALQTFNQIVFEVPDPSHPDEERHSVGFLYEVYSTDLIKPMLEQYGVWEAASRFHATPLDFLHAIYQNDDEYKKYNLIE